MKLYGYLGLRDFYCVGFGSGINVGDRPSGNSSIGTECVVRFRGVLYALMTTQVKKSDVRSGKILSDLMHTRFFV